MAPPSLRPVFVPACQRSGSTLLGAMLGAHPDVICLPEAQFIVDLLPREGPGEAVDPRQVIERISRHLRFRLWNFDLKDRRPPADTPPSFGAAIDWLIRTYAAENGRTAPRFWVDQQPGHVLHIERLHRHFPDARFVHLVRDGRAFAASVMALDWGPNEIYPAAVYWRQRLAYGFTAAHALGPAYLTTVRYEDLVRQPESVMSALADFLGTDFDPAMLRPTGLNLPRFTVGQHSLVGGDLAADRIEAWKTSLTSRQIEIFEATVGDLLPLLGYERLSAPDAPGVGGLEKLLQYGRDKTRAQLNKLRFKRRIAEHLS